MDKPFLHVFLLTRLKKNTDTQIVDKKFLKDHLRRILARPTGFPKFMIKYIINDLVKLKLIESINGRELYKLLSCPEEKRIHMMYFEG